MKSYLANLRLACGCWALFLGIWLLIRLPNEVDLLQGGFWGIIVAGAGLAVTLREAAAMLATFQRGKPDDMGAL